MLKPNKSRILGNYEGYAAATRSTHRFFHFQSLSHARIAANYGGLGAASFMAFSHWQSHILPLSFCIPSD